MTDLSYQTKKIYVSRLLDFEKVDSVGCSVCGEQLGRPPHTLGCPCQLCPARCLLRMLPPPAGPDRRRDQCTHPAGLCAQHRRHARAACQHVHAGQAAAAEEGAGKGAAGGSGGGCGGGWRAASSHLSAAAAAPFLSRALASTLSSQGAVSAGCVSGQGRKEAGSDTCPACRDCSGTARASSCAAISTRSLGG